MKQEVRQRKKQKPQEQMLAFDPAKVFDPADAKRGELEDLAASLKSDLDSSNYLARKGQGGDRSRYYSGGGSPDEREEHRRIADYYKQSNANVRRRGRDYNQAL